MRVLLMYRGDLSGSVEIAGELSAARHAYPESAECAVIRLIDAANDTVRDDELRAERRADRFGGTDERYEAFQRSGDGSSVPPEPPRPTQGDGGSVVEVPLAPGPSRVWSGRTPGSRWRAGARRSVVPKGRDATSADVPLKGLGPAISTTSLCRRMPGSGGPTWCSSRARALRRSSLSGTGHGRPIAGTVGEALHDRPCTRGEASDRRSFVHTTALHSRWQTRTAPSDPDCEVLVMRHQRLGSSHRVGAAAQSIGLASVPG